MEDHKPKLYARLRVKTGEYTVDDKTKNRYSEIGVLFATPHFSNMYMQIETLPISKDWDGRIYVNPIEPPEEQPTENRPISQIEALEIAGEIKRREEDKPIDLSEIPF